MTDARPWACRIGSTDPAIVAPLRSFSEIRVWRADDAIWLRGANRSDDLDRALRKLPDCQRFELLPDGRCRPDGRLVPTHRLPDANFLPIRTWCRPAPQPAALPGQKPTPVPLSLVRSTDEKPANALLTTWPDWSDWVLEAPEIRLRPLSFAVSEKAAVLVLGTPLPPLPGRRFVESSGIAVPAGMRLSPDVDPILIARRLDLDPGAVLLFRADRPTERIPPDAFVRARRSAIRLTERSRGVL